MGNLTVEMKSSDNTHFSVKVNGNVTISTTKNKGALQNNQTRTTVKNGQVETRYKWSNKDYATKERALNLNRSNYMIFDALRKADKTDKKGEQLTQSDLEALRKDKALQKELGVTVKYDAKEKVYGLYGNSGSTLYFDFD